MGYIPIELRTPELEREMQSGELKVCSCVVSPSWRKEKDRKSWEKKCSFRTYIGRTKRHKAYCVFYKDNRRVPKEVYAAAEKRDRGNCEKCSGRDQCWLFKTRQNRVDYFVEKNDSGCKRWEYG